MSYAAELKSIESRFAAAWGATSRVAYANTTFTPIVQEPYVRLTVLPGLSSQISMGEQRLFRHVGVIDVAIFVPAGSASKSALELADMVATIFRGATFEGIVCRAPDVRIVGSQDGWFHVNVSVSYNRDELF
jgi:hypothetical protein